MIASRLLLKQRLCELFCVEGLQVVRLLAEADEFDGQAEFLLDSHDHAAFARAIQLGHDEAGERHGLVEFARLCQPRPMILPPFTSNAPTIGFGDVAP